ncbi:hypothetical protein BACFIN_09001 [Bacteroides finegoldii DSM 17565]|nr:hypothetical protein BACFIN_09001 [Bacteroides finegoldii DSM 17565]
MKNSEKIACGFFFRVFFVTLIMKMDKVYRGNERCVAMIVDLKFR